MFSEVIPVKFGAITVELTAQGIVTEQRGVHKCTLIDGQAGKLIACAPLRRWHIN